MPVIDHITQKPMPEAADERSSLLRGPSDSAGGTCISLVGVVVESKLCSRPVLWTPAFAGVTRGVQRRPLKLTTD